MGAVSGSSVNSSQKEAKEKHRIKVLRQYAILDTPAEAEFDDLAAMAAHVCGTPIALISLVDEDRQWFKADIGLGVPQTPRSQSFCAHALDQENVFVIPDAQQDERFAKNPLVTGAPGIRFYAGAPLITQKNATLGTLCVIDREPRTLSTAQEWVMQSLARRVMIRLEQRRLRQEHKSNDDGEVPPGIHHFKLEDLGFLVCTNPSRCALWGRLSSFLALPILSGQFAYAYIGGELISNQPFPRSVDVILQTADDYGPASLAAARRFFSLGLQKIFQLHSVRLDFWMENAPPNPADYRPHSPGAPLLKNPYAEHSRSEGMARINLRDPEIIVQFQAALDPFRT